MSLERIRKTILEQAEADAEQVRRDAETKAGEIVQSAGQEAAAGREAALEHTRASCGEDVTRRRSRLQAELRMAVLQAKSGLVAQAFDTALERVKGLPESDYLDLMAQWLAAAAPQGQAAVSDGRTCEIVANERDRALMDGEFLERINAGRSESERLSLAKEIGQMQGGFVLRSEEFVVDVTLDSQIGLLRDEILTEIAKALFG